MTFALLFLIAFHLLVFVFEAFLWMQPLVYERALSKLSGASTLDLHQQALVLKPLFVNQGFYNLFLAGGAVLGLALLRRGDHAAGMALVRYASLSALGAGIVLACTTSAYGGAILQAVPGALVLLLAMRLGRTSRDFGARHDH
jgi:putative membrane protein